MKKYLLAVAIMACAVEVLALEPNFYFCKGDDVSVLYNMINPARAPSLSIASDDADNPAFFGSDLGRYDTPLGLMLTAPHSYVSDLSYSEYVWVIPPINLPESPDGLSSVHFDSMVFVLSHKTSIGGPDFVTGPLKEVVDIHEVNCTAQHYLIPVEN